MFLKFCWFQPRYGCKVYSYIQTESVLIILLKLYFNVVNHQKYTKAITHIDLHDCRVEGQRI